MLAWLAACWPGPLDACPDCVQNDDADGDGLSFNQGDCDDLNPEIAPTLPEVCNNDIDDNCDGEPNDCVWRGQQELGLAVAVLSSANPTAAAGSALARLGDLDGDGREEVAVGAPGSTGWVYRLDGRASWVDANLDVAAPNPFFLSAIPFNGNGNRLAANDGLLVTRSAFLLLDTVGRVYLLDSSFADTPNDGTTVPGDVITGDANQYVGDHLAVGPRGGLLASSLGAQVAWWLQEPRGGTTFAAAGAVPVTGTDVSALAADDFDGDGVTDLAIGMVTAGRFLQNNIGAVAIFYGPVEQTVDTADADVFLWGTEPQDQVGGVLTVLPDLSGDGLPELAVGAPAGSVDTAWILAHPLEPAASDDAIEIDHVAWMRLGGTREVELGSAFAVADLNRDGTHDLVVSAPSDARSGPAAGVVHVFHGPFEGGLRDVEAADLQLLGDGANHRAGAALVGADVDGDGYDDLLVGAPGESSLSENGGGVYVWLARGL